MVSYEELIYCFTDIYLKTAVECSVCKENYTMADDVEMLDEYMKLFVSLLMAVERDDTLKVDSIKQTLEKRKAEKLKEYQSFLQRSIVERALETIQTSKEDVASLSDPSMYVKGIQHFFDEIFTEVDLPNENPVELLRHIRTKEEYL